MDGGEGVRPEEGRAGDGVVVGERDDLGDLILCSKLAGIISWGV